MPIVIDSISKTFSHDRQPLVVLENLSTSVDDGEFVSILGPSGCGKTTLLRLIASLDSPSSGRMAISDGRGQQVRLEMVFQQPALLPWRTALDNVMLPLELANSTEPTLRLHEARERAIRSLDQVGLGAFATYYPERLSGGMRSRVALARALVTQPSVLLLDEPFSSLDELTRSALQDLLTQISLDLHLTVVFVTHSIDEAIVLADRVLVLSKRPARIISDHTIDMPRATQNRRDSVATIDLRAKLRNSLSLHHSQIS